MDRIAKAPDHIAREILLALCKDSFQKKKAIQYLDKIEKKMAAQAKVAPRSKTSGNRLKRKAGSEIKICIQCQEPFQEEENGPKAWWLNVDDESSTWEDWDENCHGPMDSGENKVEYPEAFVWDCCDKIGTRRGCTLGRHMAADPARARYDDPKVGTSSKATDSASDSDEGDSEEEDTDYE
ncbi:hypothetical protein F4779DRAFT_616153 [Xylariaceae sp. FL0662B]|nr:hypothetical protein F4779DRAFT_616153 [Xylariaceae sp. FL0662B]